MNELINELDFYLKHISEVTTNNTNIKEKNGKAIITIDKSNYSGIKLLELEIKHFIKRFGNRYYIETIHDNVLPVRITLRERNIHG